jgi:phosphate transport system substrate-binding protein
MHPRRRAPAIRKGKILTTALALLLVASAASAQQGSPTRPPSSPVARTTVARLPTYRPLARVSGRIVIWGHGSAQRDFMGALIASWSAEFRRYQPNVRIENHMYGTSSAIGALAVGAGNLAILGEEISPDAERLFERARGYRPAKIEIANGSLATNYFDYAHQIFVNRANPLARLDVRRLEAVFGAEHRCTRANVRTWGQLGLKGAWADRPIHPYSWKTDVDFALFLRERALCGSHRWNPATHEVSEATRPDGSQYDLGQQIVDGVARDPLGIGISNIRYARPEVKALALAWTKGSHYVAASDATLISREYPLERIIPAYIDRPPGRPADPAVAEFLRFILSRQGQTALIEQSGYLPLNASDAAKARQWLR